MNQEITKLLDYQRLAIDNVRKYANEKKHDNIIYVDKVCKPFNIGIKELTNQILANPITINFHPDRYTNNGKTIIENLIEQGKYHNQFRTGTTNGAKTAFVGGDRFLWEQRIFFDSYPHDSIERPKYGALNLLKHIDGATARFGSCYFTLKHNIINRCTFSYGDSASNPSTLCTSDTFVNIIASILNDVQNKGILLNKLIASEEEALAVLLYKCSELKDIGKNLDNYIEAHIHGDIILEDDVECLYIDSSFKETIYAKQAAKLCQKYEIKLRWIPKREIQVEVIEEFFRGPMIPILAKKIDSVLGNNKGIINAEILGKASQDILLNPRNWNDIGSEAELFKYIKQLWHTVAYFG